MKKQLDLLIGGGTIEKRIYEDITYVFIGKSLARFRLLRYSNTQK